MAHPCFECGSECYCHGDIDDAIVSKTPGNCIGCGCDSSEDDQDSEYDDVFDDDDDSWQPCDNCDLPDACADFGCAIEKGIRRPDGF
jgi:hypothetical protein